MSPPKDEALAVFVAQLNREIHRMWHDGQSREAALAEARDRIMTSGGIRPYLRLRLVAWTTRGPTSRAAEARVRMAFGAHACDDSCERYR